MKPNPEIEKAIELAGSQEELASKINQLAGLKYTQAAISGWSSRGKVPPYPAYLVEHVLNKQVDKNQLSLGAWSFEQTAA